MLPIPLAIGDRAHRLRRDRRGAAALVAAAAATTLIVGAAIAVDGGLWLLTRRTAQNAADAAALAGAVQIAAGGNAAAAQAAARDIATRNGFTQAGAGAGVTVRVATPYGGNANAVEVEIRAAQTLRLARVAMREAPVVVARAVAVMEGTGPACVLTTSGPLAMQGNADVAAPGCILASNARDADAISLRGSASARAASLRSAGGCEGCADPRHATLSTPASSYQPPMRNPYAKLDDKALPSGACATLDRKATSLVPFESSGRVYCDDIKLTGKEALTLTPGTYVLRNAALSMQGGALTCPTCTGGRGVTLVFTGDPGSVGDITINGNAELDLRAPANPADPDWRGVVVYRDARATSGGARLNGGADVRLTGAVVMPSTHLDLNGNNDAGGCTVFVTASMRVSGTGDLSVGQCGATGTPTPQATTVRIIE